MEQTTDKAPRTQYHHGDLRAHLIETVRILVEEKGADGFSISEAARRAGVSSAAPYKHFNDRAEIVREVALAGIERMRQQMDDAAKGASGDALAPITALGLCYANFARAEPGVFRLMFGLTKGHERDSEMRERGDGCLAIVKREVRAAMPDDTPEAEIERRSLMLHMFVHGHAFLEIDGKHELDLTDEQEAMIVADISRRIIRD
ncbi:TetR/AcrR family transcriptional regulator [uncultured Tateyamaria sp.]|uniref:TetR/AcrR family transcriptional regulator n=1 Tax=uncultured Tateyamaria sp. TaxID=455651 RepID=UPI001E0C5E16|nr:TetR/AcrR family transcriptional regulator [uncultured Tateyamaria sp.]MCB4379215.1 TetR/AcrR family transcriptional regulator [Synechococcus sp. MU1644]